MSAAFAGLGWATMAWRSPPAFALRLPVSLAVIALALRYASGPGAGAPAFDATVIAIWLAGAVAHSLRSGELVAGRWRFAALAASGVAAAGLMLLLLAPAAAQPYLLGALASLSPLCLAQTEQGAASTTTVPLRAALYVLCLSGVLPAQQPFSGAAAGLLLGLSHSFPVAGPAAPRFPIREGLALGLLLAVPSGLWLWSLNGGAGAWLGLLKGLALVLFLFTETGDRNVRFKQ